MWFFCISICYSFRILCHVIDVAEGVIVCGGNSGFVGRPVAQEVHDRIVFRVIGVRNVRARQALKHKKKKYLENSAVKVKRVLREYKRLNEFIKDRRNDILKI